MSKAKDIVIDRAEDQTTDYLMPPSALMVHPGAPQPPTIGAILSQAVDKGMDPAALEKLVALYERMADRDAAHEFARAMAAFQAECPAVPKTATANIVSASKGTKYSFTYAPLEGIADHVRPFLTKHGLSYTWDSAEEGGKLSCTCTVRHVNGHSVKSGFTCSIDTAASMSGAQKSGGAFTYARRQSLVAALGLTTTDPDDDGSDPVDQTPISEHQAANLSAMLDEVASMFPEDKGLRARYLGAIGVEKIVDLPAAKFKDAIDKLESKRSSKR